MPRKMSREDGSTNNKVVEMLHDIIIQKMTQLVQSHQTDGKRLTGQGRQSKDKEPTVPESKVVQESRWHEKTTRKVVSAQKIQQN